MCCVCSAYLQETKLVYRRPIQFRARQIRTFQNQGKGEFRELPIFWHFVIDQRVCNCHFFGMRKKASTRQSKNDVSGVLQLSRRERQIMDALYRLQKGSAADIWAAVPNPPSYTAIRTHLTLLEQKNLVKHDKAGARYIYSPVVPREEMGERAIEGVLKTFFDDSVDLVITALMKRSGAQLSSEQINRLERMIEEARKDGR
jgi:predicted transcriptional regulator